MAVSTVTSKGQITIPAEVRRNLGLKPGSRVTFVPLDSGTYEFLPVTGTVKSLQGIISAPEEPVTIEQLNEAVAGAAANQALP